MKRFTPFVRAVHRGLSIVGGRVCCSRGYIAAGDRQAGSVAANMSQENSTENRYKFYRVVLTGGEYKS